MCLARENFGRFVDNERRFVKPLTEQLENIRESSKSRIPEDAQAIMHRATEDLRSSGIMDGVPGVGASIPHFVLNNTKGEPVRSQDLIANGALVLTFFRGKW